MGDAAPRPGAPDRGQVDAQRLGAAAHGRRGLGARGARRFGRRLGRFGSEWSGRSGRRRDDLQHLLGEFLGFLVLGFQLDQRRAHRGHFSGLGGHRQHLAAHRRGDLHRGLFGHHIDQRRVLLDEVPHGGMPGHDLGLGGAFAHVGQLEGVASHAQPSITLRMALATRRGPGKYSHSKACG